MPAGPICVYESACLRFHVGVVTARLKFTEPAPQRPVHSERFNSASAWKTGSMASLRHTSGRQASADRPIHAPAPAPGQAGDAPTDWLCRHVGPNFAGLASSRPTRPPPIRPALAAPVTGGRLAGWQTGWPLDAPQHPVAAAPIVDVHVRAPACLPVAWPETASRQTRRHHRPTNPVSRRARLRFGFARRAASGLSCTPHRVEHCTTARPAIFRTSAPTFTSRTHTHTHARTTHLRLFSSIHAPFFSGARDPPMPSLRLRVELADSSNGPRRGELISGLIRRNFCCFYCRRGSAQLTCRVKGGSIDSRTGFGPASGPEPEDSILLQPSRRARPSARFLSQRPQ
ncbi:unnamed protein product [Protopolystoma xenopodis]|uniref:Uncharacterized protein n=1 Tax=Protopolystoma xenopodis TaxID=117903 RepID=A0A3S5B533_9PLAT|nr:unnamed protein product [Protopolystoma xenopodis]